MHMLIMMTNKIVSFLWIQSDQYATLHFQAYVIWIKWFCDPHQLDFYNLIVSRNWHNSVINDTVHDHHGRNMAGLMLEK